MTENAPTSKPAFRETRVAFKQRDLQRPVKICMREAPRACSLRSNTQIQPPPSRKSSTLREKTLIPAQTAPRLSTGPAYAEVIGESP